MRLHAKAARDRETFSGDASARLGCAISRVCGQSQDR
jgi:hypothetical protein